MLRARKVLEFFLFIPSSTIPLPPPASLVWLWKGKRKPSPKRRFRSLRIWNSFPRVSSTVSVLLFPQRQLVVGLRLRVFGVVGGIDLQGCGCDLHWGGAGAAGLGPEEAVPRCDAGELPEPAVRGWGWRPVAWHHPRRVPYVGTTDFWGQVICRGDCPEHFRMFSSVPGPLPATSRLWDSSETSFPVPLENTETKCS